ncbi:MAG: shikimate dehydrogenase [Alphaproteobacteria bacterium]|nr:shikimate dehydrogenase [Alphaproteobacteria bacterium SS10]
MTSQDNARSPSGAARVTGLIGWPVSHSLSPALHNYWLRQFGIDGMYAPFPVHPDKVGDAIEGLRALGVAGANVTVPHKTAVMPHLDKLTATAGRLEAVNTLIVHKDGLVTGDNTDAYGFESSLKAHAGSQVAKQIEQNQQVMMVGAGGAARAVLDAVLNAGYSRVVITNRTPDKADALAAHFQQFYPQAVITTTSWDQRADALNETHLLINTTSLGMAGKPALDIDVSALPGDAVVADIVYVPLITPLLSAARDRGLTIVDGLDMLLYQAQAAFEAWHGERPPVDAALRQMMLDRIRDG